MESVLADFAGSADREDLAGSASSADRADFEDFGQPEDHGANGPPCRGPADVVVIDGGRYESGDGTYDEVGGT